MTQPLLLHPREKTLLRTIVVGAGEAGLALARDLHRVTHARVRWEGADQGALTPVVPPVHFGFGSTPRTPSLVRITTLIRHTAAAPRLASET